MNWEIVDKYLMQYKKKYHNKQKILKDNIQSIFDKEFTDLNTRLNNNDLTRFKRYLEQNEDYIKNNGYVAYLVLKYKNKSRITYKELLNISLLIEYAKFEQDLYNDQFDTLVKTNENVYSETINECLNKGFKKHNRLPLLESMIILYLASPNNLGVTYQEANDTTAIYNANEIYKQAVVNITQNKKPNVNDKEFSKYFAMQEKREINRKTTPSKDKFSGSIDNENTFLLNQIKLNIYQLFGVEMVEFNAITDDKSTLMCQSLKGQKFYLNKMNVYDRYSKADEKNVIYHSEGMVLGENLPPINNNFHWCRSWIEIYVEE